jgi:beta-glucanase (GH16 family)
MRVRWTVSILVAMLVACGIASSSASGAVTTSCGKTKLRKASGQGFWTCTFGDEFQGAALNRSNWDVMNTATMGLSHGGECFVDDPANIRVGGGFLTLRATKLASPAPCGWFSSPYRSGMIFTGNKFAQTHGRFEVRAKFPKGSGFASGFWMWPRDMAYGNQSGEIDIAEHYGAYPGLVAPSIHIVDPNGGGDRGKTSYCNVANPGGQFHTYAVEWLPLGGFKFLYDGVTCMTFTSWDPGAPLSYPQPFDKPFFMALTLALGWAENSVSQTSPFPAEFVVDYVRAWK